MPLQRITKPSRLGPAHYTVISTPIETLAIYKYSERVVRHLQTYVTCIYPVRNEDSKLHSHIKLRNRDISNRGAFAT